MQGTLTQQSHIVNLSDSTFAVIDRDAGFVAIHEGQRQGLDSDWGGKVIAWLTLDQAEAIAAILYAPFSQPDEAYKDVQPAQYRDDYIGD